MTGDDFSSWLSILCRLNESGSDAEFVEKSRSFAAECGVTLSDDDLREWFRFDDGTLTEAGAK